MAFFQFGRKLDLVKQYSLQNIPLFSSLTPHEQRLIEKNARLVECKRGDIIFREGATADAFFVVLSGRYRLFGKSRFHRSPETMMFLYRGDHFGETSLLTGRAHSATVEAKRDGILLKLEKDDFLRLVRDIPALSLHLNRSMGHRLTRRGSKDYQREVKILGLCDLCRTPEGFKLWIDFAASLLTESRRKVVVLDFVEPPKDIFREEFKKNSPESLRLHGAHADAENFYKTSLNQHPSGVDYIYVAADAVGEGDDQNVHELVTALTYHYDFLMLRLPAEINSVTHRVFQHFDAVYVYTSPHSSAWRIGADLLQELNRSFGFSQNEILLLMPVEKGSDSLAFEASERALGAKIFSRIPCREKDSEAYGRAVRYLAKDQAGTLIGLALGSGAAYGLAHIGVLRVLEREGIPVDVIAGASIGALIGGLWAGGHDADGVERIAKSIDKKSGFFKLIGFRDFSPIHKGFLKGDQIGRFLEAHLGDQTIHDLRIPVKIVGADLFTSEEIVFDSGRVVDAIRASIAIPGILTPVPYKEHHLIDGGVVDPLPVRVLSAMGVKKIIAVNVLAGPRDRIEQSRSQDETRRRWLETMAEKGPLVRAVSHGLDKMNRRYAVNIFNIIMNTIQFLEYEIADAWGKQADILIHPIVPDAHWAEFYDADKFIKAGEAKTMEQIEEIRRLVKE